MVIPDKLYDILKWLALIVLPACATIYAALANIWGWSYATEVAQTITAVCTFIGAFLGISTADYRKGTT